jgi:hypothetical protein
MILTNCIIRKEGRGNFLVSTNHNLIKSEIHFANPVNTRSSCSNETTLTSAIKRGGGKKSCDMEVEISTNVGKVIRLNYGYMSVHPMINHGTKELIFNDKTGFP